MTCILKLVFPAPYSPKGSQTSPKATGTTILIEPCLALGEKYFHRQGKGRGGVSTPRGPNFRRVFSIANFDFGVKGVCNWIQRVYYFASLRLILETGNGY
jgi:hypothetical protein